MDSCEEKPRRASFVVLFCFVTRNVTRGMCCNVALRFLAQRVSSSVAEVVLRDAQQPVAGPCQVCAKPSLNSCCIDGRVKS